MTSKSESYRKQLRGFDSNEFMEFLLEHSGLPGPRGNLELADAAAIEGDESLFLRLVEFSPDRAPTNSPEEFLAFCGVVGLGRLVAEGQREYMTALREFASDPRWRVREGVARGLQLVGESDMEYLIEEMDEWSRGGSLEKRAVAAALCEPKLLSDDTHAQRVLDMLNRITESILAIEDRTDESFRVLRTGLGYCWSVAVVASPVYGKQLMESWFDVDDEDIRWIMRENLKKNRLERVDAGWVAQATMWIS